MNSLNELHPVLLRQLQKVGISTETIQNQPNIKSLIDKIDKTYRESDKDRYLRERAMEVSAAEMGELYDRLQEERVRLQSILSDGICITDETFTIKNVNEMFCSLVRHSPDEVQDKNFITLFSSSFYKNKKYSI
jgi:PAS domain-containing protein